MAGLDLGPTGAVLSPADPDFVATAVELDRLGFSTIWLTGGPMTSLSQVGDVVRATSTARIATGIIPVVRFESDDVAALYRELETEHPGRFVVGLGGAHGPEPLGTLNAYLDRLDGVVPPERRVLAALGPRMIELATSRAAGALPVLITPEYAVAARETLGPDRNLAIEQLVILERDADRAREIARGRLGFFGQLPAYHASWRRMGFADEEIESLGDALVDGVIAWGGVNAIVRRLGELRDAGADHVAVSIVSTAGEPSRAEWAALAQALLPA